MMNKNDFENLVYEKAEALAEKEHKYVGYRKAIISTAAAFTVLTAAAVGSVFVINNNTDSIMPETNAVTYNTQAGADAAENYDDYAYSYNNDFSEDVQMNELNSEIEEKSKNFDVSQAEEDADNFEESVRNYDKASSDNESERTDIIKQVEYSKGKQQKLVLYDKDIYNNFVRAIDNLKETYDYKTETENTGKHSLICTIALVNKNPEYGTEDTIILIVYKDYVSFFNDDDNDYNNEAKRYIMSEELSELIKENFDENFMDD